MRKERTVSTVAALAVLMVFAVSILSALLAGAGAYQRLTSRYQTAYESRTAAQYLATKVRQAQTPSAVAVGEFCGAQALKLTCYIHGETYVTWVYCHDGYLMELFCLEGADLGAADGEKILPMKSMTLSLNDGLLTAKLSMENATQQVVISVRGAKGWQP